MTETDRKILDKFKALLSKCIRLHKMILFGSRARGDAEPESDMDVVVIVDGPTNDEIKNTISECAWEAGFEHGIVVVPVTFSRDEWEKGPERESLFVLAVERDGVLL
jgi:predicted nucleotidyltransferase